MNKLMYFAAMTALVFSMATTLPADEKASCDDLEEIIEALDQIADVVEDADDATLNKIDGDLAEVIQDLQAFAQSENKPQLTALVRKLKKAFQAKDQDRFVDALDDVTDKVEAIEKEDCE